PLTATHARSNQRALPLGAHRYAFAQAPPMSIARSLSVRRSVSRKGLVACSKLTTALARVQSVPHRQRSNPHASNMRASGSQISGYGYGLCESVQAPLTLMTAFDRFASSSTLGRSAHGFGAAGGVRG